MNYVINENDMLNTIQDFETLCSCVAANKPTLTPKGSLNTKTCFDMNSRMVYPVQNVKKTDWMQKYPSIVLYFSIAMESGLLETNPGSGQKLVAAISDSYAIFQQMSKSSKYLFIFLAWMRHANADEWYASPMNRKWFDPGLIELTFEQFGNAPQPAAIYRKGSFNSYFGDEEKIHVLMNNCPIALCHLRDLGFIRYHDEDMEKLVVYRYAKDVVNKVWLTELGITLSAACSTRRFSWVNTRHIDNLYIDPDYESVYENDFEQNPPGSIGFLKPFMSCFPEGEVDAETINQLLFPQIGPEADNTVYEFQVSLARDCYRIVKCRGTHTFEDLHLAIQHAFGFGDDHLYAFYMDGRKTSGHTIKAPFCQEPPSSDEVRIGEARLHVGKRILYLFDFGDDWRFGVTLLSISESDAFLLRPVITKWVGDSPEQYPNYDEDCDDDG